MKVEWEARLKDDRQTVGEEEIANVISMMSGVPVQRMAQAEGLKLAGMKEELQAKVIAQDAAIEKLTKAILRSRVGLKDPNHPIGTLCSLALLVWVRRIWQSNWQNICLALPMP